MNEFHAGEARRPLRVGLLAPPWIPVPPTRYGGTESVIDRLARGLVHRGHEVLLWTTGNSTCPVLRGWKFAEAATDQLGMTTVECSHAVHGYEAFARWEADIVHDHTLLGPLLHRSQTPPVVTTNHGPFADGLEDLYGAISPQVPIIAISADQARRAGRVRVSTVIHHGIDLDEFSLGSGLGDAEGPYLLFLGRMAESKGVHIAARVAARAGFRLVIAAKIHEPEEQAYFDELVRPLLGDRVMFAGEVDPAERLQLLQGATALVNPIQWPEPFGLVMIEALACGTPVVAFARGAAPEIVEHGVTGFLAPDEDRMVDLLSEATALDRVQCRESAERRFATARMVDDHLAFYRKIIAGDRPTWSDDATSFEPVSERASVSVAS